MTLALAVEPDQPLECTVRSYSTEGFFWRGDQGPPDPWSFPWSLSERISHHLRASQGRSHAARDLRRGPGRGSSPVSPITGECRKAPERRGLSPALGVPRYGRGPAVVLRMAGRGRPRPGVWTKARPSPAAQRARDKSQRAYCEPFQLKRGDALADLAYKLQDFEATDCGEFISRHRVRCVDPPSGPDLRPDPGKRRVIAAHGELPPEQIHRGGGPGPRRSPGPGVTRDLERHCVCGVSGADRPEPGFGSLQFRGHGCKLDPRRSEL
jgi:hypothetical protein